MKCLIWSTLYFILFKNHVILRESVIPVIFQAGLSGRLAEKPYPPWKKIFGGTVPPNNMQFGGTIKILNQKYLMDISRYVMFGIIGKAVEFESEKVSWGYFHK
jgi:hypothetical protein